MDAANRPCPSAASVAEPIPAGPARNGLIAYSYAGDIYVGDPPTGQTAAIVTNPQYEVNPVFSPDGEWLAFIRGDPETGDSTIVVVRADGTDERTVLPEGRQHRGFGGVTWTPDGASLVVQLDRPPFTTPYSDGELSLFDAFGSGCEQLLAPPLPQSIGAHYFIMDNQVAPMFRPPKGDLVLSAGDNEVRVFDPDLTASTPVGSAILKSYEPFVPDWLTWSPDGRQILFLMDSGLYVLSADGSELRHVATSGFAGLWSPDSSRIAFGRARPATDEAVLVVVDLTSGEEHVLESTAATGKDAGARFSTITNNNVVHHWFHEGWMWAPDGRDLLVLDEPGAHPWVVDVVTDTATELPWFADSMPTWQRLP